MVEKNAIYANMFHAIRNASNNYMTVMTIHD